MSARTAALLAGPREPGYQPPHTYTKTNTLKLHAYGCRVDGGPGLPPGVCRKCAATWDAGFLDLLGNLDRRAR